MERIPSVFRWRRANAIVLYRGHLPGSDWVLSAPVAVRVAFSYSVLHRVRHSYICLSVRCSQTQQPPYWLPQCRGVFDGVSGADVRSSSGIGRGKDHVGKRWRVLRKYISFVPEIANRELPAGGHFHCFRCYRETGLVESMIGEISHRLIDDANDCSSPTSALAKAKPHKLTSSCSGSFEKEHTSPPCGLQWRKLVELFRKKDSRFYWYDFKVRGKRYRGSTRGSTKETNKKRAGSIAALRFSQAIEGTGLLDRWTGRLPACRSSRPGSEAGSN